MYKLYILSWAMFFYVYNNLTPPSNLIFELSWENKVACVTGLVTVVNLFFLFSCSFLVFLYSSSKFQNNPSIYFPLRFDFYFFYYYLFYMKKIIKLDFFQFHPLNFLYIKFAPYYFDCYSSKEVRDLTLHWFFFSYQISYSLFWLLFFFTLVNFLNWFFLFDFIIQY